MTKAEAIQVLRAEAARIKARDATGLYLFGSTVRDAAGAASDLDLFIDYDRQSHFSLIELVGLKQFIEDRIGAPVDLTTRDSLETPS